MEGFLQSLKFSDPDEQRKVCKLTGFEAKKYGNVKNAEWRKGLTLYWKEEKFYRKSKQYKDLLIRVYSTACNNSAFEEALRATKGYQLTKTDGGEDRTKVILTSSELCEILTKLRLRLK